MPRYAYRLVDVFTREPFGGNPLAVFPDAEGLEPSLMQRIAFELNLSETTFVLPATRPDCDVRVRIFTPRAELPFAGHPTVGTAFVLDRGARIVLELGIGPVAVEQRAAEDGFPRWRMTQPAPRFEALSARREAVSEALGLEPHDLAEGPAPEIAAVGMPFAMIALRDLGALGRARLRPERWCESVPGGEGLAPYLFVRLAPAHVRARMFAGHMGIPEDAATGSAAGPLGGWLVARGELPPDEAGRSPLLVEQGVEMGRRSQLYVEAESVGGAVSRVHVSGECVALGGGYFDL